MVVVITEEERHIFELVNFSLICCIVALFGISANIINMFIFYKQGFKNTVNIGFFGLSISDMICLITLEWASVSMNPLIISSEIPWYPLEVMYLSAAWPHCCFSRITSCITVYVTAERYLSIAIPLKVKTLITPKVVTIILFLIYLVNIATLFPEYATSYLGWRFVPIRNQTLIALLFTEARDSVEGVVYVLHCLLGMASFGGVILFTVLLVSKLRQSSKWRNEVVTSSYSKRAAISNRDQKTVKMIVFIACVLIACYTPGVLIALTTFIVGPEFNIRGKYINICEAVWSIAFSFQSINSSVNIFVYYSMSSKYRQTFDEIICNRKRI